MCRGMTEASETMSEELQQDSGVSGEEAYLNGKEGRLSLHSEAPRW